MNQTVRTVLMWLVILVAVLLIFSVLRGYSTTSREIAFSDFLDSVAQNRVSKVLIKGEEIHIKSAGSEDTGPTPRYDLYTYNPGYDNLISELREHNVEIKVEKPSDGRFLTALLSWAPLLILVGLWFVFFRQMQAGGTKAMSFGKTQGQAAHAGAEEGDVRRRRRRRTRPRRSSRRSSSSSRTRRSSSGSAAGSPRACC